MQNCLYVLTHSVTGSVPSNVSELLPHNSSSHFLCSLSHMHVLKLQLQNLDCFKFFVTVLWSPHREDPPPPPTTTAPQISGILLLSFPSETNSRHFSKYFNFPALPFIPVNQYKQCV